MPNLDAAARSSIGSPSKNSIVSTLRLGELRDDRRDDYRREIRAGQEGLEVHHRPGFVAQVELLADLLPEAVEHLEQPARSLVAGLSGDDLQERLEHVEVGGHHPVDERAQDLHPDHPAVVERSPVHHRHRGTADRLRIDLGVGLLHRHPEVGFDPALDLVEPDDRPGVEAGPELVGHGLSEDARERGDELAELDERSPEILERETQRPDELACIEGAVSDLANLTQGQRGEVLEHRPRDRVAPAREIQRRRRR